MTAPTFTDHLLAWLALAAAVALVSAALGAVWRRRPIAALLATLALGLVLRGYSGTRAYLHPWDERYHALVARNLLADPLRPMLYRDPVLPYDYRDWQANHVWLHKPLLALWLMAGGIALFGNTELGVRAASIALSLAGILLTYAIGRRLLSRESTALAALLHALNPLLGHLAVGQESVDHVDTLLVVLVQLGIWLALRLEQRPTFVRLLAVAMATGLALLTKWLPGLLVVPVLIALRLRRPGVWRSGLMATFVCGGAWLLALPWETFAARAFPEEHRYERAYNWRHLWEPLEGHARSPVYQLVELHRSCGGLVLLPATWLIAMTLRRRRPRRLALLVWWLLPLVVFSLVATQRSNYMAIAMPALCLTTAHFWTWLRRTSLLRGRPRWRLALLVVVLVVPITDAATFVNPLRVHARRAAWAEELRVQLAQVEGSRAVLFNTQRPIEAMFYGDVTAYAALPEPSIVATLVEQGYRVHVIDGPDLPLELRGMDGVRVIPRWP